MYASISASNAAASTGFLGSRPLRTLPPLPRFSAPRLQLFIVTFLKRENRFWGLDAVALMKRRERVRFSFSVRRVFCCCILNVLWQRLRSLRIVRLRHPCSSPVSCSSVVHFLRALRHSSIPILAKRSFTSFCDTVDASPETISLSEAPAGPGTWSGCGRLVGFLKTFFAFLFVTI
jgi:hypothetical protein